MAGVFPVSVKNSGRKQWTLYNGTRSFGRNQLAKDGSPESQVVLAKQLLDEKAELEIDQEENARMGVYWLMKASEQGHEEATDILRHCLDSGQGITEHNYLDVKACLAMSHDEKIARQAAKQLFASMAGGDDFITSDQLDDCMKRAAVVDAIDNKHSNGDSASSSSTPDWKSRRNSGVEKLTEEMLVSAASNYSKGELPLVHRAVLHPDTNHYNVHQRRTSFLMYPVLALTSCCNRIINTISKQNVRHLLYVACSNLQAVLFLWIMMRFDFDTVVSILPAIIYFASLITMIIATCQALSKSNDFQHFRSWSNLFLQYSGGNLNAAEAEYQHCCRNLQPYSVFFVALLIHLVSTPIMLRTSSPQSEITVIAFVCTILTLYKFSVTWSILSPPPDSNKDNNEGGSQQITRSSSVDLLGLFSFAVNVLARYPYETDEVVSCGWRFLDVHVPTFASYVVGNGVEFCLNFRALFYLVIPAVSVKMASRDKWKGTYTSLIPHCMSLAWWQITVLSSQGATWYGLIRSALAIVGFVLFLPLAGLATVLVPVVAAGKFLLDFDGISPHLLTTFLYAVAPVLIALCIGSIKKKSASKWNIFVTVLQIVLFSCSVCLLILWPPKLGVTSSDEYGRKSMQDLSREEPHADGGITWPQFQQLCTSPVECSELYGLPVRWEGRVTATRLSRISNPVADLTHRLPRSLQAVIKCWYGEKYAGKSDSVAGQSVPSQLLGECHLASWNRYEYEVDVVMTSGLWRSTESFVTLVGLGNSFSNMTSMLKIGDHIWFSGTLVRDASGLMTQDAARVETDVLGCVICKEDAISNIITKRDKMFTILSVYSGIKAILNFFFNPLVIFK